MITNKKKYLANNFINILKGDRSGQSLVELVVGLGISIILVGAVASALVLAARTSRATDESQTAATLTDSLLDSVALTAEASWINIYNLAKGSTSRYFLVNTSTTSIPVLGTESVFLDNINSGLIAHWKFDEASGSTVYDSSGYDRRGAFVNSPDRLSGVSCKAGGCLSFSDSSRRISLSANILSGFNKFSLGMWVYENESLVSDQYLYFRSGLSGPDGLYIEASTNKVVASFSSIDGVPHITSSAALTLGVWNFVELVYDATQSSGSRFKIYINGNKDSALSTSDASADAVGNNNEYLGGVSDTSLVGKIDDVRIYSQALTSEEIQKIYMASVFNRYFYVTDVSRMLDGSILPDDQYDISLDDPSTKKVFISTDWCSVGGCGNIGVGGYVTRWLNVTVTQLDWSMGDLLGPYTDFGNKFYSSFNLATGSQIKIEGY